MRMMGILGRGVLVAYCHQDILSAAALIFPLIFFSWVQWLETLMAALRATFWLTHLLMPCTS